MMVTEMGVAAMLAFARVNVNRHVRERGHGVKEIVPNLLGNGMALAGGHLAVNGNVELGALAMTHRKFWLAHIQYRISNFNGI